MRRILLPVLLGSALFTTAASAQYSVFDRARYGQPISAERPEVRLLGMGRLDLVVEDENNEINLADFSNSLAGQAEDRDGWSLESWVGRGTHVDDYLVRTRGQEVRQRQSLSEESGGTEVVYRKDNHRAIGLVTNWFWYQTSARYGDETKVRGPRVFAFYNENFGRLRVAIGTGIWKDNEDLKTTDIFSARHYSTTLTYRFDAAYQLRGWDIAGQIQLDDVMIEGKSRDASGFHQDDYDWTRPAASYTFSALRSTESLDLGGRLTILDRSGKEEVIISWSDRFPANPSNVNYETHVPTFEEEESGTTMEGRALLRLGEGVRLGAGAFYETFDSKVTEDPSGNFIGSRRGLDLEETRLRAGGGALVTLFRGRLQLGAEGYYVDSGRDVVRERFSETIDSRRAEVHAGLEYLLPSRIAVRGGYQRGSEDENMDLPNDFYISNGYTVGLGWTPRGGTITVDGALRILEVKPDYDGWPDRQMDRQELVFSARFLL